MGSDYSDDEFSAESFRLVRLSAMGSDHDDDESSAESFRLVRRPAMGSGVGFYISDDDDESSPESFRLVRRCKKLRPEEGAADDVSAPAPAPAPAMTMAALSPLPPSSPASSQSGDPRPHYTVESIFSDFKKRHGALVCALTKDEETFVEKCDPGTQPLYLYGSTDGSWEVKPTLKLREPAPPEPTPGINLWRDAMERQEWLQKVAVHCDAWLMKISNFAASYIAATERDRLFDMIIDQPTVRGILLASSDTYRSMYCVEEKRSSGPEANAVVEEERSSGPNKANEVVEEEPDVYLMEEQKSSGPIEANKLLEEEPEEHLMEEQRSSGHTEANEVLEEEEEDATNDDDNLCATCNSRYKANAFWIGCDECGKWYHGKCVNVTPSGAEHMERYECPDCRSEKDGWS